MKIQTTVDLSGNRLQAMDWYLGKMQLSRKAIRNVVKGWLESELQSLEKLWAKDKLAELQELAGERGGFGKDDD